MDNVFEFRPENRPEETRSEPNAGPQNGGPKHEHEVPPRGERRTRRRAMISAAVRVRQLDTTCGGPDETSMTLDVSRSGILFASAESAFEPGMEVAVTFPYTRAPETIQAEQIGMIARVSDLGEGRRAVAVAFTSSSGEIVDSGGRKLSDESTWTEYGREKDSVRPLILVMDGDAALRACLKVYLKNEGYDVIAVGTAREARDVLDAHTPALLIAEIEGDDLPGYDLCAHVKSTPRLQTVPVMLLTRSAYPSDYANAHSLGAIVCMAKPFRQERLGHVVRLLAPPPHAKAACSPPRPGDPKRRTSANQSRKPAQRGIRLIR